MMRISDSNTLSKQALAEFSYTRETLTTRNRAKDNQSLFTSFFGGARLRHDRRASRSSALLRFEPRCGYLSFDEEPALGVQLGTGIQRDGYV